MTILVTGGAGFTGRHFVLDWLAQSDEPVLNRHARQPARRQPVHCHLGAPPRAQCGLPRGDIPQGWIDAELLQKLSEPLKKNGYGQYLLGILKETQRT